MLRVIEGDLRALSLEARRRFPEVKEAAERALQRLRIVHEQLPDDSSLSAQGTVAASKSHEPMPISREPLTIVQEMCGGHL
eukprot:4721794-Pleurochrysis_carterae.AAC.2